MNPTRIVLVACIAICGSTANAQEHGRVLGEFIAAFNAHDAQKMAAMVTGDFQLFYVSAAGQAELATSGPKVLQKEMTQYFQSLPSVKSVLDHRNEVGDYVSFRETATWQAKDGTEKSQSSLAVYQVQAGKIHRVWYYPAQ